MATKFRKGQRVVCTHYKDRPIVKVEVHYPDADEVWVLETKRFKDGNFYTKSWWGPRSWFKAIRKPKPITKPRGLRGLIDEGSLCDSGIAGCTCNQWSSVGE